MTTTSEETARVGARLERIIWDKVPGADETFPTRAAHDIMAEFIVIHRDDLPDVSDMGYYIESNGNSFLKEVSAESNRALGLANLAVAEYKESQDAEKAAKDAGRNARRNKLARDLSRHGDDFDGAGNELQAAINMIITLEEAAA